MRITSLVLVGVLGVASGCGKIVTSPGDLGKAQFEWSPCDHTRYQNCLLTEAMATGSTARVNVYNGDGLGAYTAASADATVFTAAQDGNTITVQGILAGSAKLVLTSAASGEVIDQISVAVTDAASLAMTSPTTSWKVVTMIGGQLEVGLNALDAGGDALVGDGVYTPSAGVAVSAAADATAITRGFALTALATGDQPIGCAVGAATATLTVHVAGGAEIAAVAITGDATVYYAAPSSGDTSQTGGLYAQAALADGSTVYAPATTWTVDKPDCLSVTPTGVNNWEAGVAPLKANCTGTVTATVGSASTSVAVQSLPLP